MHDIDNDKERNGAAVKLEMKEFPPDAAFHLSNEAKYLCVRNLHEYHFIDLKDLDFESDDITNPPFGKLRASLMFIAPISWTQSEYGSKSDIIVWHGFCSYNTLIGTYWKGLENSVYTLDVSRSYSEPKEKRSKLGYKNFTFSYDGKS